MKNLWDQMNQTRFQQHVSFRKKPGIDILNSLTPEKCDLMHMTTGLVTECREVQLAVDKMNNGQTNENLLEELGDVLYYLYGIVEYLKEKDKFTHIHTRLAKTVDQEDIRAYLNKQCGGITLLALLVDDKVKSHVYYEKDFDHEGVYTSLQSIIGLIENICMTQHVDITNLMELNYNKLSVRYPDGYTNKNASRRLDKDGTDEEVSDEEKTKLHDHECLGTINLDKIFKTIKDGGEEAGRKIVEVFEKYSNKVGELDKPNDELTSNESTESWEEINFTKSDSQQWSRTTRKLVLDNGYFISVTTRQKNPDGTFSVSEAIQFVEDK